MTELQAYTALLVVLALVVVYDIYRFVRDARKALRAERRGEKVRDSKKD
jgi:uncharacterized membrane protein